MSNYEKNLKPYSDFNHKVAPWGGPEQYVAMISKKNYELGVAAERSTELGKALMYTPIAIGIWEACKWGYRKIQDALYADLRQTFMEAEEAKAKYIKAMRKARLDKMRKESTSDETSIVEGGEGNT